VFQYSRLLYSKPLFGISFIIVHVLIIQLAGRTPLHYAGQGHKEVVAMLLDRGADIEAKDRVWLTFCVSY
jgi:hypothetical protein